MRLPRKRPQPLRPKRPEQKQRPHVVLSSLAAILSFSLCFAGGYGLTSVIYRHTGTPPELWEHIFSGLMGIVIFAGVATLARIIAVRFHKLRRHQGVHSQLLNAMTRIAQGDFDVFVEQHDGFPHDDIAEGINKIARELGSMEQLRQDFISNVSHEIQSPLTSIRGFAALLKNDRLTAEQRNHYLGIIEAESKRLSALSDNLLKLSALESGDESLACKEYRLDKQLEEIALMLEPQWRAKQIALEADLEKLSIQGDEGLLSQVWVNLLHNAVKFTPEGGVVRVVLEVGEAEVYCRISDTGIGIAPEDQIHIFERFYKVDKSRERALGGNGLGLSLVRKIVELHGGQISLESGIGKGAAFTVTLPRKQSD